MGGREEARYRGEEDGEREVGRKVPRTRGCMGEGASKVPRMKLGGREGLRIYSSGQRNRHNREKERKLYSMRRFII